MIQGANEGAGLSAEEINWTDIWDTIFAANILARYSDREIGHAIAIDIADAGHRRAHLPIFFSSRVRKGKQDRAILAAEDERFTGVDLLLVHIRAGNVMRDTRDQIGDTVAVQIGNRRHRGAELAAEMQQLDLLEFRVV